MEPRLKWNKVILVAKIILFRFRRGSINKTVKHSKIFKNYFISFHDGTTPEKNLGRSTDGGSSGLKFFKMILF